MSLPPILFAATPFYLDELAGMMPAWLLLLGACIGHGFLMTVGLNVLYAWPLPHEMLKMTRKIDLLIILAGPVLFFWAMDVGGSQQLAWDGSLRAWAAPYVMVCWIAGFFLAPVCQVAYWLRRTAPHLVATNSQVVDVAKELGYPPAGQGKHAKVTRFPGNQVFQVEFMERTFELPRLPLAWDGLSILHLTDLHFCGTPDRDFHSYVLERCQAWGTPDIVAITGDIVDSSWHHRWIVPLLGRLKWNVAGLAILGNHDALRDTHMIRRRLVKLNMRVLGNRWETIDVRGQPMVVVGHEGPWFRPIPDLTCCPPEPFKLLLSHTPDNIGWARRQGVDLMLAGHVHGGQIRVPLIGSLFVPSRYSRRFDCGAFYLEPTVMYVGRGLAGQHPLRLNCRPEVTRIVLRCGDKTNI